MPKGIFFPSLFSPFTGNRNIIKSRWKRNPFPKTNKNQLWLILREAFRGGSQENAGGFCPYLSFLPAFEDHMFTAWLGLLHAHRNFYQLMRVCWNVRSLIREGPFLARPVPCAVCILATGQSRGQRLDTNQGIINEAPVLYWFPIRLPLRHRKCTWRIQANKRAGVLHGQALPKSVLLWPPCRATPSGHLFVLPMLLKAAGGMFPGSFRLVFFLWLLLILLWCCHFSLFCLPGLYNEIIGIMKWFPHSSGFPTWIPYKNNHVMSILLTIHKIQLLSIFLCNTAMVKFTWMTRANQLEISRRTQKQCSHTGHIGVPEQAFTRDGFPGTLPACLKSVYIIIHSQALTLSQTSRVNTVGPSKACSPKRTLSMLPCMCPSQTLFK